MLADNTLSNFSDLMFRTSFVIYAIALIVGLVFYVKVQGVIDARRQRENAESQADEQAGIESDKAHAGLQMATAASSQARAGQELEQPASSGPAARDSLADGGSEAAGVKNVEKPSKSLAELEAVARKWSGMAQTLIWLGIIVHAGTVLTRGMATGRFPFGNMYEYSLMLTLLTMVVAAIVISQRQEWRVLWPWLMIPVVILMFVGGSQLYAESAPLVPALRSFWLPIHVGIVVLGGSIGMVSGMASLLYLLRRWQPKGQERGGILGAIVKPLPSAKKLDGLAYKSAIVTLPVLGLGIVLGAIWAEAAWGRPWNWDPKETVSLISWILYAAYLHARATAGWRAMRAAWINIVALATMIFNFFFINMVVSGLHSYAGLT